MDLSTVAQFLGILAVTGFGARWWLRHRWNTRTVATVRCSRCGRRLPRDRRFVGLRRTWLGQRWVCWSCTYPDHDPYNPWR